MKAQEPLGDNYAREVASGAEQRLQGLVRALLDLSEEWEGFSKDNSGSVGHLLHDLKKIISENT